MDIIHLAKSKGVAVGYLLLITILFLLPGSDLPRNEFFAKIHLDKWIHAGIFFLLYLVWSFAFRIHAAGSLLYLLLAALCYGCLVELVQENFVSKRSFDWWDIVADGAGAGLAFILRIYKKNKPL